MSQASKVDYRALTAAEIAALRGQGCSAVDWGQIEVAAGFDAARVRNTHFIGEIKIGDLSGGVVSEAGMVKDSGIYNAVLANCRVGNGVRIANVAEHIGNYDIGDGAWIENVGTMETAPGATFGNGVEVEVLNEAGGREVIIFDELNVQFAYLMCVHRYRSEMIEQLNKIAKGYVEQIRSDRGKVGAGAHIRSTGEIRDVNIGVGAKINGAASLVNGTILSSVEAPTEVGVDVQAKDFIIAESSSVTGGAILGKVFVGQGCQVGKQYSAENSVFFANSEAFHGEACAVFGGPYTVTHHKSTLLIAGLFSFYNAGSGSNQSNHMYKLGPVHEGKLERGTKTGSFSYMMWPCRTGPFAVVLGKHTGTFDTSDYPFSHHEARADGKCAMVPGLSLTTVGTVRDGAKWPSRDRRKGSVKRDRISFDVFSPYTVGKMIRAAAALKELQANTDKSVEEVCVGGAMVRRPILRTGQKFYRNGIEMYLGEKVFERIEEAIDGGWQKVQAALQNDAAAIHSDRWCDIGGQLMPVQRVDDLCGEIAKGAIGSVEDFYAALDKITAAYKADEWAWVRWAYEKVFGADSAKASKKDLIGIVEAYGKIKGKFLKLILADATKEFDELSHSGFGIDGSGDAAERDFEAVRGTYEGNSFVKDMQKTIAALDGRVEKVREKLGEM